jgi:hypothetical protein
MAVNKVDLYVSQILEDLNNGLTWLKSDDIGYGSIQEKYNAKEQQISMIRKHPTLKDAETNITVFNIIDDTKDEKATTNGAATVSVNGSSNDKYVAGIPQVKEEPSTVSSQLVEDSNQTNERLLVTADTDDLSAFVNL